MHLLFIYLFKWRRNFRDKEMVSLAKALKVEINYKNSLFCTL
jgi:hypothetical protein